MRPATIECCDECLYGCAASLRASDLSEPMVKLSLERMSGLVLSLGKGCLLVLPVGFGAFLAWQEWRFRDSLATPTMPVEVSRTTPPPREMLDATAVATVLGLTTGAQLLPSAEPLTLQASFVINSGLSKALLADSQGSRIYEVGERLPGGSVLRRIEANQVVLWSKGREELLTLKPAATAFLHRLESRDKPQAPTVSPRFLLPHSGLSE